MQRFILLAAVIGACSSLSAREWHVSPGGDDAADGSTARPLRTISAAARVAQPGDEVVIHGGVYRERVDPPRGGTGDDRRIVYRAAPGEKPVLKGSEPIRGWEPAGGDTWKVAIPNSFFGKFNPYADVIRGDWFNRCGREHHTGVVYLDGHWLTEADSLEKVLAPAGEQPLWFGRVEGDTTTLWAQFKGVDPNRADVEINVRQAVFYPTVPGVNYITVRGLTLMHAATPWAPPTAEQIGLIGTHWSRGWIIEDNDIRYSTCTGITLGKHGDEFDNTSQNTAEGYVKTIERALARGWSKENIGGHIVRRNLIAHCEQAGIVGSMGAAFSTVTGNEIHDIHVRRLFTGAEMAGIKFHAAIDAEIAGNHIYHTCRGIWLDWMTQGTRVHRNVLHDNGPWEDLFVEVNHGPFLVDHNIMLSPVSLLDVSEGGAYAHNLFAGRFAVHAELNRQTPFHAPHSTKIAGLRNIPGGDNRFYNNIFLNTAGFEAYDRTPQPVRMAGNVYLGQAPVARAEAEPLVQAGFDPEIKLNVQPGGGAELHITLGQDWGGQGRQRPLVTTGLLGRATVPDLPFEKPDGSPYRLDVDYFGRPRGPSPFPGPFELPRGGRHVLQVWPVSLP